MTKHEFLETLGRRLSQLPKDEVDKQLAYYAELIDDMMEDGILEERAVEKLGDVSKIAETVLHETPLPMLMKSRMRAGGGWTALRVTLLVLGAPVWLPVLLALFAVLLAVYLVIWSITVVLFAAVLAVALAGLLLIVGAFMNIGGLLPVDLLIFGAGVALAGISILAFFGALAAAKGLVRLTALIARGIKSLFIRKENRI